MSTTTSSGIDNTPIYFNFHISGASDALDVSGEVINGVYTETAALDNITWIVTKQTAVDITTETATFTHNISNSEGFSATQVATAYPYTLAAFDMNVFDGLNPTSVYQGDFGNFTQTWYEPTEVEMQTSIFTTIWEGAVSQLTIVGTMTTMDGGLLEGVNVSVYFDSNDNPIAMEGNATRDGETFVFDTSMLLPVPADDSGNTTITIL